MSLRVVTLLTGLAAVAGACGGTDPPTTSPSEATATPLPGPAAATAETASGPNTGCVPALFQPDAGAVLDSNCTLSSTHLTWEFSWSTCPGAESYHLWVKAADSDRPAIDDRSLKVNLVKDERPGVLGLPRRTAWRWRVRSKQAGVWNPWSEERPFEIDPIDEGC